jgi:hypothetical protein
MKDYVLASASARLTVFSRVKPGGVAFSDFKVASFMINWKYVIFAVVV